MKNSIPQVYDQNLKRLGFLQNAMSVSYTLPLNSLYTAGFSLPADDPKNEFCQPLNFMEIYDGAERVELFRVIGEDLTRSTESETAYTCEHVLATLLNDVLFKYHQVGGVGVYTPEVLRYILDHQEEPLWQLGQCDFKRQFEYKWENESLLSALFSVASAIDEPYMWTYDTTARPWRLNLIRRGATPSGAEIRYRKNMKEIRRTKDASCLVTRLYALGYGEGDNQLGIESVNGGRPYLEADTKTTYGLISSTLIDRRFESPETLKAYAQTMLDGLKQPYLSYEVSAIDLARLSGGGHDRFLVGDTVRIIDQADSITVDAAIVELAKDDVRGAPGDIKITLANKSRDVAGTIADLQSRSLINQAYAQGATNLQTQNYSDNADPDHPATFKVYITAETARINKMLLSVDFEPFRGYSKGVAAGGGSTSTTEAGGGSNTTTSTEYYPDINIGPALAAPRYGNTYTDYVNDHNHGVARGTGLVTTDDGVAWWSPSGGHQHSITQHEHEVSFQRSGHDHQVYISAHKHEMITPAHTHPIEFGIYEGSTATTAQIIVDGKVVPTPMDWQNIDIVAYLATDNAGKIQRNTWHTIQIKPDKLTRVVAALFTQLFTNSRGGGDY